MTDRLDIKNSRYLTYNDTSTAEGFVAEAWDDLKRNAKRDFPDDRVGAAITAAKVSAFCKVLGAVGGTVGAIAYPIHKAGDMMGFDNEELLERDKQLLESSREYLLLAPIAEIYAGYTLFVPPKKQK